jgi:hypothetical protein
MPPSRLPAVSAFSALLILAFGSQAFAADECFEKTSSECAYKNLSGVSLNFVCWDQDEGSPTEVLNKGKKGNNKGDAQCGIAMVDLPSKMRYGVVGGILFIVGNVIKQGDPCGETVFSADCGEK